MPRKINKTKRSIEKLHHFSCGFCKKWWTVGDAPESRVEWFCPWCGEKNYCHLISK